VLQGSEILLGDQMGNLRSTAVLAGLFVIGSFAVPILAKYLSLSLLFPDDELFCHSRHCKLRRSLMT